MCLSRACLGKALFSYFAFTTLTTTKGLSLQVEVWDGTNRSVLSAVLSMGYPVVYAGSYYLDHLQLHWEDDLYSVDPGTFSEVLSLNCLTFSFRACLGKSSYHQVKTHYVKKAGASVWSGTGAASRAASATQRGGSLHVVGDGRPHECTAEGVAKGCGHRGGAKNGQNCATFS
jgi:hypothetical protein